MRPAGRIARLDLIARQYYQAGEIDHKQYSHMLQRNQRLRRAMNINVPAQMLNFNKN